MNRSVWLTATVALLVLLAGAGLRMLATAPPRTLVTVYFTETEQRFLVPVTRAVGEATPAVALAELLAGPLNGTSLAPAVATATRIDLAQADGRVVVTASPEPGPMGQEAIARTLLSLPGVHSVSVSGRLWTETAALAPEGLRPVYYPYGAIPVPVWRPLAAEGSGVEAMRAALLAFLHDPPPPGLHAPPPGVQLADLVVKGDVAHVQLEFSPEIARAITAGAWNFAPYYLSVIYTLTEFPGIRRVQFDFPGLTAVALAQCRTPLSIPLPRPEPERGRS